MVTAIEYGLMAGASYISTRAEANQFPTPNGWLGTKYDNSPNSGFEVVSFVRTGTTLQTSTEIVISFAGTADISDWLHGNMPLALGMLPDQLRQAADYYLQIKASAPAGASIRFTGHSLGGGLASLMAVMFGESAFTFDQAPFRSAALMYSKTDPMTGIVTSQSVAQDLLAYLQGEKTNGHGRACQRGCGGQRQRQCEHRTEEPAAALQGPDRPPAHESGDGRPTLSAIGGDAEQCRNLAGRPDGDGVSSFAGQEGLA